MWNLQNLNSDSENRLVGPEAWGMCLRVVRMSSYKAVGSGLGGGGSIAWGLKLARLFESCQDKSSYHRKNVGEVR